MSMNGIVRDMHSETGKVSLIQRKIRPGGRDDYLSF